MGGVQGVWQSSWFMCRKCGVLFRADADFLPFQPPPAQTAGSCPAGGAHDGGNGTRFAVLVGDSALNAQGGWRRCDKCSGLFLGTNGHCPQDNQPHEADGGDHLLANLDQSSPSAESGWLWCLDCEALFFSAASASICPGASGGPHRTPNKYSLLPPAHVAQYAVLFDRSLFLPHGRACASGANVNLNVQTATCLNWVEFSSGNWDSAPQSPWQLRYEGASSEGVFSAQGAAFSVQLSARMDPGGGCIIDDLVLRLTPSGSSLVEQNFPAITPLLPGLSLGLLGSPNPLPCTNFFAGVFGDCEYGDGGNNNGVGTLVSGPGMALQFWPKREDRIRLDVILPTGAVANFEFDTQE